METPDPRWRPQVHNGDPRPMLETPDLRWRALIHNGDPRSTMETPDPRWRPQTPDPCFRWCLTPPTGGSGGLADHRFVLILKRF